MCSLVDDLIAAALIVCARKFVAIVAKCGVPGLIVLLAEVSSATLRNGFEQPRLPLCLVNRISEDQSWNTEFKLLR